MTLVSKRIYLNLTKELILKNLKSMKMMTSTYNHLLRPVANSFDLVTKDF